MSVKLLFNNIKAKATCPCCGSVEDECICTTLEELGATELEVDFAIAGKYAGITFSGGTATRTDYGYTWVSMENNGLDSSKLTLFRDKMTELGRTRANDGGTDYYTYYNTNVYVTFIYWNYTLYGSPNITRLNKLMTFTDEQLEHLNKYGKCVIPCECCGEVGTNCYCVTQEEEGVTDLEIDFALAMNYAQMEYAYSSNTRSYNGYSWQRTSLSSTSTTLFKEKMTEFGRTSGVDYYIYSSYVYWNVTLCGVPQETSLRKLTMFTEEELNQLHTYSKYTPTCMLCEENHSEMNCELIDEYYIKLVRAISTVAPNKIITTQTKTFTCTNSNTNEQVKFYVLLGYSGSSESSSYKSAFTNEGFDVQTSTSSTMSVKENTIILSGSDIYIPREPNVTLLNYLMASKDLLNS